MLKEIKKFMDGLGVKFMLFDGVLLGAIREKNFIKWDWDVELAIRVEDIYDQVAILLEAAKDSGFSIINIVFFFIFFATGFNIAFLVAGFFPLADVVDNFFLVSFFSSA